MSDDAPRNETPGETAERLAAFQAAVRLKGLEAACEAFADPPNVALLNSDAARPGDRHAIPGERPRLALVGPGPAKTKPPENVVPLEPPEKAQLRRDLLEIVDGLRARIVAGDVEGIAVIESRTGSWGTLCAGIPSIELVGLLELAKLEFARSYLKDS